MFLLRVLLPLVFLFFAGLAIAWFVTRDRRYLVLLWRSAMVLLALLVLFGLIYVFERVLLL